MTPATDTMPHALDDALQQDSMPLWLWDPQRARIFWANAAYLVYSGASALDDLRRLRFRRTDGFVRQMAVLAAQQLGEGGRRELIYFSKGRREHVVDCLCRNMDIAPGQPGLLVGLISDAPQVTPTIEAAPTPEPIEAPQAVAVAENSVKNDLLLKADAPLDSHAQSEALEKSVRIIDTAYARNGFYAEGEEVDEDDLMTLQEIARMINGGSGFGLGGDGPPRPGMVAQEEASADRTEASCLDEPAAASQENGAAGVAFSRPNGRLDAEADLAGEMRPDQLMMQPPVAAPARRIERNYFLESLPAAIAISMGGRLMRANEAFLHGFGFGSESELRKAGGLASLFPDSRQGILVLPEAGASRARAARIDLDVVDSSGHKRHLPVAFRNVSTGHAPVQIIIIEDLQLTQLSAEKSGGQAAEPKPRHGPADDSLSFLAQVNHEVRTPLNSIIGFSELIKDERLGQNDIHKLRGYAEDIHQSAIHALSLINDLLDITKIMAGKPEQDLQPLDLNQTVSASLQLMKAQLEHKKLILKLRLDDDIGLVLADKRSLKQVLLNLISNAIKFTLPGGRIELTSRRHEDGGVVLTIRDTGIGMSRAQLQKAMQPFTQLEKVLKVRRKQDKGTGLGLPMTKALVEAHGAGFFIDSTPGMGTSIIIRFPATPIA